MRRLPALVLLGTLGLVAAACGSSSGATSGGGGAYGSTPSSTTTTVTSTTTGSEAGGGASAGQLTVTSTDLGAIVVDGEGMTVYLFTPDTDGQATCTDACASAWPPVVESLTAGAGVTGAITEITRPDGSTQLALAGHPLYRYVGDGAPGDVAGQGIGGNWYVLDGAGDAITSAT